MHRWKHKRHARWRAQERYGLPLSPSQYEGLVDQIAGGAAPLLQPYKGGLTIFAVQHRHLTLWAVYQETRHTILTFLPPAWAGNG